MKPNCHGSFLRESSDGLLSLPDVKANECKAVFGNARKDTLIFADEQVHRKRHPGEGDNRSDFSAAPIQRRTEA